jgi:hypothetical protein
VRAALGRGEKRSRVGRGAVKTGRALPFYRGRRGVEVSGLHGRRQCLDLKAPVTGVKSGRGCYCGLLMMGSRVKRVKSQSSGLHGTGGREGAVHLAWVARAPARGGEGMGKGIGGWWAGLVGWPLDGLGQRPLGRKAEQADSAARPTWPEQKRNSFQKKN